MNDKETIARQSRGVRANGEKAKEKKLGKLTLEFSTENDFQVSSEITMTEVENEMKYRKLYDAAARDADQSSVSVQADVSGFTL